MADRTDSRHFRDRRWYLMSAPLGLMMDYTGSFIEGDNADLMVASPVSEDDGFGLWIVLPVLGAVLVAGSLVMSVSPRRSPKSQPGLAPWTPDPRPFLTPAP